MTPEMQVSYCSECGRPTPPDEMVHFGDRAVCPACKDVVAQKLREGVAPAGFVRYGGFWLRFVAVIIDGIIMAVPTGIINALVLGWMGISLSQNPPAPGASPEEIFSRLAPLFGAIGVSMLLSMTLAAAYETFFIVQYAATPGKMALGLKVLRPDGTKLGIGRALGRHFAKMLSAIILYIGYIMAGFDAQKRALHDMICDTRVIKTRG